MQTYCSNTTRRWVLSLQRDGRILRQGNMFDEVYVYRYITENTFDSYLWQIQENKQKFITQIITNKSPMRSCDDIDGAVLSCAEIKTLATGDPRIKEKMQLDNDIYVLQIEKSAYQKERMKLQNIALETPKQIDILSKRIDMLKSDIQRLNSYKGENFKITIGDVFYDERAKAGEHFNKLHNSNFDKVGTVIGNYCGFDLVIVKPSFCETPQIAIKGELEHRVDLGLSALGNISRIENTCDSLPHMLESAEHQLAELEHKQVDAVQELKKPFTKEDELREKLQKQVSLNSEMEIDKPSEIVMKEDDENGLSNKASTQDEEENEM